MAVAVFHSSRAVLEECSGGSATYERAIAELFDSLSTRQELTVCHFVPRKRGWRFRRVEVAGKEVFEFRSGWVERIAFARPHSCVARIAEKMNLLSTARFLRRAGFDLAYFSSPSPISLRIGSFPYILTIWDLGHLELPGFAEVWARSTWLTREEIYSTGAIRAMHVFVDSVTTGKKLEDRYGIQASRWTATGLLPQVNVKGDLAAEIEEPYIIYPSKFWPHKNHLTILKALKLVKDRGFSLKLVLTGSEPSEKLTALIDDLGLTDEIVMLGSVERQRLLGLIKNAQALVMPTLLGPTNLPPLEALQLGVPAIVSDVHHFGAHLDSLLVSVPALDSECWAEEIIRAISQKVTPEPLEVSSLDAVLKHEVVLEETREILQVATRHW